MSDWRALEEELRREELLRRRVEKDARELGRLLDAEDTSFTVGGKTLSGFDLKGVLETTEEEDELDLLPFKVASGASIDKMAGYAGLTRHEGETDEDFRGRIIEEVRHATKPKIHDGLVESDSKEDEHADKDFMRRLRET